MIATKPRASYKHRMAATDAAWLIWSNKNGCWYRTGSQGYTSDILQAGIFSREEAETHYNPAGPRRYRVTEPFPLSAARRLLKAEKVAAQRRASDAAHRLAACDLRLARAGR